MMPAATDALSEAPVDATVRAANALVPATFNETELKRHAVGEAASVVSAIPQLRAALLALMGLLQGDGALANVALQRAEAAWPGHRFTATLRGLAAIGIRPGELRNCLTGAPMPGASRQRPKHRGRARGGASRSARRRRHGR